jgi:hypothetical protein
MVNRYKSKRAAKRKSCAAAAAGTSRFHDGENCAETREVAVPA